MHRVHVALGALALLSSSCCQSAAELAPLRVCLVSGSWEYDSHTSLEAFSRHLMAKYPVKCTLLKATARDDLPGLEALDDCDVALFFTRRLEIDGEQLNRVKHYCLAGKPIVAVRTACHGFQKWLEMDKLVLGGNYHNHFKVGPSTTVTVAPEAKDHPVLNGVGQLDSKASLYRMAPLANDCELLLSGATPESGGPRPVAWTRRHEGGRVFFTSLGAPSDFANPDFRRLLVNALFWTARREPPAR